MTDNCALTVAIPIFNLENYINRCVDSFNLSQCAEGDIELLLIDDGSTDYSGVICQKYESAYPKMVRYIRKQNGHYGSVINLAIHEAKGAFFKIIDGDDTCNYEGLRKLVSQARDADDVDLILTDYVITREGKGVEKRWRSSIDPKTPHEINDCVFHVIPMHAQAFKTELLKQNQIRLSEGIPYTDTEFRTMPLCWVRKLVYIPEVVYEYHLGRDEQTMNPATLYSKSSFEYHMIITNHLLDYYSCVPDERLTGSTFFEKTLGDWLAYVICIGMACGITRQELRFYNNRFRNYKVPYALSNTSAVCNIARIINFRFSKLLGGFVRVKAALSS